jgi:hypothetical protein
VTRDAEIRRRVLGRDAGVLTLEGRRENRAAAGHMAAQAQRELCLFTRDLDKAVYDQSEFLDAVKSLALRSGMSRVRVLLQDHGPVLAQGHRLIELARRLSSSIEIRVPPTDWLDAPESYLLADRVGYLHRDDATAYRASADFHAPLETERLQRRFDDIWEASQADGELRRLHL